jgi:hypothetical protein
LFTRTSLTELHGNVHFWRATSFEEATAKAEADSRDRSSSSCSSRVDPATSVNTNVTVPVGSSRIS